MIRRLGRIMPGRVIGIRVNPALGVGYGENQLLRYSGDRTSKFGIYKEQFAEALALARQGGLSVEGIHFHVGCGYLDGQLDAWAAVLHECRRLCRCHGVKSLHAGAGQRAPARLILLALNPD